MLDPLEYLTKYQFPQLTRENIEVLQVNLGYKCNQRCRHCHVNAGPNRTEQMSIEALNEVKKFALANNIKTLDLTGGAPEIHPAFCEIISWAVENEIRVIDRCNLTILLEPGFEHLASFLARNRVEIIGSLPCYLKENVDAQRGAGTYDKSIRALKTLNGLNYGKEDSGLILNLVYNPQGAVLPPAQHQLEQDYKQKLWQRHKIRFNKLLTLTNLPIARFGSTLLSRNEFFTYMELLMASFKQENMKNVMCKSLISVSWDGTVYDCDFNQMLGIGGTKLADLNNGEKFSSNITTAGHCYGCTSGQGSGCFGALE